ncbi:MAG TPA: ABC transporter ATP-binding protein [Acidimicrobiales bacterium]|nr:ABC transporter ATP-binding protein [Acidimicrobiales bacterium]
MPPLLEVDHLSVGYGWQGRPTVTIVRDVSLTVGPGEVVGLAGESGCGKTTLALAASGLLDPPGKVLTGAVRFQGKDLLSLAPGEMRALHLREVAMVFQASMNVLNPVMRVRDQFLDAMKAHGVRDRDEAVRRSQEMFELVKIPQRFFDAYPHQLSGGMRQRAVIALALVLRPKLLFLDEPTTALDVVVQRSILQTINDLRGDLGFGVVFITHDLSLLVEMADRIAIMYAGRVVEQAPGQQLYEKPLHPYTQSLMTAFPPLGAQHKRLEGIAGQPPDMRALPSGCSFAPRCPKVIGSVCWGAEPHLMQCEVGHQVSCYLYSPSLGDEPAGAAIAGKQG